MDRVKQRCVEVLRHQMHVQLYNGKTIDNFAKTWLKGSVSFKHDDMARDQFWARKEVAWAFDTSTRRPHSMIQQNVAF